MLGVTMVLLAALAGQGAAIDCGDAGTQLAINECFYSEFQKADAELNRQWARTKAVMAGYDKDAPGTEPGPTHAQALLASQRAWLAFRDTQCAIEGYAMRGGSGQAMLVNGCKATLTRERVKQLADLIEAN
jgi:uncharacterized protein YecT (DUF1311 family)